MDETENILWGVTGLCAVVWLVGWVGFNAGIWIHTFIVASLAIAIMVFATGLKEHQQTR